MRHQYRTGDFVRDLEVAEGHFIEPIRQMAGSPLPAPRQLFSSVFARERFPMRTICLLQLAAQRAGRSLYQVMELNRAHDQWVEAIFRDPLGGAVSLESAAESERAANHQLCMDEMRLMREMRSRSRATLEQTIRDANREIETATLVRKIASRELWSRFYGVRVAEPVGAAS